MSTLSPAAEVDTTPLRNAPRAGHVRWTVCAMLFVATTINYMDRQVFSVLKPTLMHDIGLTEQGYGYVVMAFQLAYAVGLMTTGRLMDRLGSRIGYAAVMGWWSLAGMGTALVSTVSGFSTARVALGLGEGGNFPAAIKAVADWFPKKERSFATGIFNAGSTLGAMIAPYIVGEITVRFGWKAAFLTVGVVGLPWIAWWYMAYRTPDRHKRVTPAELAYIRSDEEEPTENAKHLRWLELVSYRQTWALTAARALTDPIWWFYLFWLPGFLHDKFGLNILQGSVPLMIIYAFSAVGGIGGGWLPAFFVRRGMTEPRARFTTMLLFAFLAAPMLFAAFVHAVSLWIVMLGLAVAGHQGWSANMYTTVSDVFPPRAVGSVTGISITVGALVGAFSSVGTGHILQLTGSYTSLFMIAGSMYFIAWTILRLFAGGLNRIQLKG